LQRDFATVYGVFDLLYASEFDKWDLAKSVIAETLNDTVIELQRLVKK